MLIGKNSDKIVVIVFVTTNPVNIFSVRFVGNFANLATKVPKIKNKKNDNILEKSSAIMLNLNLNIKIQIVFLITQTTDKPIF
jgi:hypothetical protein